MMSVADYDLKNEENTNYDRQPTFARPLRTSACSRDSEGSLGSYENALNDS